MSEIIDSYKKVFENKKAHIWLFILAFAWSATALFSQKIENEHNTELNIISIILNIVISFYSIHFLHNAIFNINKGVLPSIKEIKIKRLFGMLKIYLIWALYAFIYLYLIVPIITLYSYILTHIIVIPIICIAIFIFLPAGLSYINIAYADEFNTKDLWKLTIIFKFIKSAYKPLYINICLFILLTIGAIAIYIVIFLITSLIGIDEILPIADNLYAMDIIMNTIASYLVIITWYFAFPYSLISSYKELIRPMLKTSQQPICEKGEE